MEIEFKYIITLNEDEASALKKFIGASSPDSRMKVGLTETQAYSLSELYDLLNIPENEE